MHSAWLLAAALLGPVPPAGLDEQLRDIRRGGAVQRGELPNPFTLLVWNIDRGTNFEPIRSAIANSHPDVVLLQEVDLHARRSERRDVSADLARILSLEWTFGYAFQELNQGSPQQPAWQGQANLSSARIQNTRVMRFKQQSGFWKPKPYLPSWFPQRRWGGRIALVSEIQFNGAVATLYNLHLESREPAGTRFVQLEEVLADADGLPPERIVVLAGDLNTKFAGERIVNAIEHHGFRNCFGTRHERTHRLIGDLDWIFVRGAASCKEARVRREMRGSDHYPLTASIYAKPH